MPVLFQIGLLQVEVLPFNFEDYATSEGFDFAAKDVIGAPRPREATGEADTELCFHGKLFPHRLGGLDELALCSAMARSGDPQMVVRGDGQVFGWYLIEKFETRHATLNAQGVGREIGVEVRMVKSPTAASAQSMLTTILGLFG